MGKVEIEIALLELIDGNNILKKLMLKANKVAGEKNREKIFDNTSSTIRYFLR